MEQFELIFFTKENPEINPNEIKFPKTTHN